MFQPQYVHVPNFFLSNSHNISAAIYECAFKISVKLCVFYRNIMGTYFNFHSLISLHCQSACKAFTKEMNTGVGLLTTTTKKKNQEKNPVLAS